MNRTEMELKAMGKHASAKYLYEKIPMDDTILQLTKTAELNPHQVARVCEAANQHTYDTLWGMHKNAEFVFDMADQEKIAAAMNSQPDSSLLDEGSVPVESIRDLLPSDVYIEDSTKRAEYTKIASAIVDHENKVNLSQKTVDRTLAKLASLKNEIELAIINAKSNMYGAEKNLTMMLKSAALQGEDISMAYAAGRAVFPEHREIIDRTFTKVAEELKKYKISFIKSHKLASAGIISENAKGDKTSKVVNKNNPVIKSLNTIINSHCDICDGNIARNYVVTKIESIKSGIRRHDLNKE